MVILYEDKLYAGLRPTQLSGLALWLDAADTSTITSSGGAVSQWNDKSGNAYHATQGTATNQPVTNSSSRNNKNVIVFDSNDFMTLPSGIYTLANGNNTLFAVSKRATETGTVARISSLSGSGSTKLLLAYNSTSGQVLYYNNASFDSVIKTGITNTSYNIIHAYKSGTTQSIAVNNGTATTDTAGTNVAGINEARIGASSSGTEFLVGEIAELILYNNALTTVEALSIAQYLANKWNITLS